MIRTKRLNRLSRAPDYDHPSLPKQPTELPATHRGDITVTSDEEKPIPSLVARLAWGILDVVNERSKQLLILVFVIVGGLKKTRSAPRQEKPRTGWESWYVRYYRKPFRLHNASCPWLLWPHTARVASYSKPSISPRALCRLVLYRANIGSVNRYRADPIDKLDKKMGIYRR